MASQILPLGKSAVEDSVARNDRSFRQNSLTDVLDQGFG